MRGDRKGPLWCPPPRTAVPPAPPAPPSPPVLEDLPRGGTFAPPHIARQFEQELLGWPGRNRASRPLPSEVIAAQARVEGLEGQLEDARHEEKRLLQEWADKNRVITAPTVKVSRGRSHGVHEVVVGSVYGAATVEGRAIIYYRCARRERMNIHVVSEYDLLRYIEIAERLSEEVDR